MDRQGQGAEERRAVHRHRRGAEAKPRSKVTILTFADFCLIDSLAYGI